MCWNNRFKFGVKVPLTVEYYLSIDQKNGNTLCYDSIGKDINNSKFAFNFLDRYNHEPVGYKEITRNLILDV